MPSRFRTALAAAALVALPSLVTGCGGDDEPRIHRPSAAAESPAPEAPAARPGGRLGEAVTAAASAPGEKLLASGGKLSAGAAPPPDGGVGVAGAASCPDREVEPTSGNLGRVAASTLCLINAERARRGRRPLTENGLLTRASLLHSGDMVRGSFFAHESPSGSTLVSRLRAVGYLRGRWTVGENLAWGSGTLARPAAIVQSWLASPGHRRNMLSPRFTAIGLGIVAGTPAGGGGATYTTDFGRTG